MSRILLADDSAHAQRMGERILREEGYEVVSVTDGDTAVLRLEDVAPDLVIADALLPGKSGYELCEHVKRNVALRHTRVLLAVGLLEPFDEARAERVGSDGILKKPFEASMMLAAVKPLVEAARIARGVLAETPPPAEPEPPPRPEIDAALLRAAVTVAMEAALPAVIDDITRKVLEALERSGEVEISGVPEEVPGEPPDPAAEDTVPAPEPPPAAEPAVSDDPPEPPAVAGKAAEESAPEPVAEPAPVAEPFAAPLATEPAAAAPAPVPEPAAEPAAGTPVTAPEPAPAASGPAAEPASPKPGEPAPKPAAPQSPEEPRVPEWRGFHLFR